jgi:hypothetical protein
MTTIINDPRTFLITPAPLDIKGGKGHHPNQNNNDNTNCHEQYKNIGRMTIILCEV